MMDLDAMRRQIVKVKLDGSTTARVPRHRQGEHFLRGPIPLTWLAEAAHASGAGSGFRVAIAIWYLVGLHRDARTVQLTRRALSALGVGRHAGYRGLAALESAGLVSVVRRSGCLPWVTVNDVPVLEPGTCTDGGRQ